MSTELSIPDRHELLDQVSQRYLKGTNPTAIGKELGLKRVEVLDLIEDYKSIARNDEQIKDRAREALHGADAHLNMIIARSWETVEQADRADDLRTKATVLKNIADVEGKRVDMLQKAGLYDDAALGDELAAMEEKQQILMDILREVTAGCDHCRFEVARRLGRVSGKVEDIVVKEDGSTL